jgi:citrate lyase subunit beta / citryl-CoA lyase
MIYRSLLFVPGDDERKISKALATAADAIVFDLEDAVADESRAAARALVRQTLRKVGADHPARLWVRVNPVASELCIKDLAAVVQPGLAGVMVPKPDGAHQVPTLSNYLLAFEAAAALPRGSIKILAVVTETAKAFFDAGSYGGHSLPRLAGVLWGAEDLAAVLGAVTNTDAGGEMSFTYRMARSFCLVAAAAADCQPIDTVFADFRDAQALDAVCRAARREGFLGKVAIHPGQVDIINDAFTPGEEEVRFARAVLAAFQENPGKGTVGLNGRMLDRPHYVQARRLLEMVDSLAGRA